MLDDTGQVVLDRIQVHGVFQPGREGSHGLITLRPCRSGNVIAGRGAIFAGDAPFLLQSTSD
jgi:hypothetical protein